MNYQASSSNKVVHITSYHIHMCMLISTKSIFKTEYSKIKAGVPIFTTSTSYEIYGQTQWMMQDMYFLLLSKLNLCIYCVVYTFCSWLNCIIALGCIVASKAVSGAPFITNRPQSLFSNAEFSYDIFLGEVVLHFSLLVCRSTCVAQPTITNSYFCKSQNYPGIWRVSSKSLLIVDHLCGSSGIFTQK